MKSHELRLGPDERANADKKNTVLAKFCTNTESDLFPVGIGKTVFKNLQRVKDFLCQFHGYGTRQYFKYVLKALPMSKTMVKIGMFLTRFQTQRKGWCFSSG